MTAPDMSATIDAAKVEAFPVRGIADDLAAERAALRVTDPGDWIDGTPMDPLAVAADPQPALPGFPFMHRGGCAAVVSGPTGAGRSSLLQACSYDASRAGLRVGYLERSDQAEFNARAANLANRRKEAITDGLRADLAQVRYLNLASAITRAWAEPSVWVNGVVSRFDVLGIDPISAVASALAQDFDKSNADFVGFFDRLIQPLVDRGVAVVLLENIGHATEARTRAKGASAKQDRADLTFSCVLKTQPAGLIITARKVRSSPPRSSATTNGYSIVRPRRSRGTPMAAKGTTPSGPPR